MGGNWVPPKFQRWNGNNGRAQYNKAKPDERVLPEGYQSSNKKPVSSLASNLASSGLTARKLTNPSEGRPPTKEISFGQKFLPGLNSER